MSAGLREKIGIAQVGVVNNLSGQAAVGLTTIQISPLIGMDYIVVSRVDFAGVTNSGASSYIVTNGGQGEAGFCANGNTDTLIVSKTSIQLTIDNGQATPVFYNIIYICFSSDDYDCYVVGTQ